MNQLPIPPIISDMISKLESPTTNPHEKNNIAMTLENIGRACVVAADKWRDQFNKAEAMRASRKIKKVRA